MVPQPSCWWKSDEDPVYSQATNLAVKSWGSAEIVQTDRFSLTFCSFKICNEILNFEILNIKYQIFKLCNEILKGAFFLRCPCWSLCQVFSWKLLYCLMWSKVYFRSFVLGFPWAFDFFRFGACPLEGEENNFETRADCQKVSLLIGLKRMRKGAMIYFYHIFLEKYLWNILKNSSRTLLKQ